MSVYSWEYDFCKLNVGQLLTKYALALQQMQLPLVEPILVLALAQSTWMVLAAPVVKQDLSTALEALLSTVDMATQKMLEYDVKVWKDGIMLLYFVVIPKISTLNLVFSSYYFFSVIQWQLYLWRCSSGRRLQSV